MLIQRMLRAARLDPDLYYEVERDQDAIRQAFLVVLIAGGCPLLSLILAGLYPLLGIFSVFTSALWAAGYWICWCAIAQLVGARLGSRSSASDLLRPLGFAHTPSVLRLFAFLPGIGTTVSWVAWIWTALAAVVAVRETTRMPVGKAVATVTLATLIMIAIDYLICKLTGTSHQAVGFLLLPLGR